MTDEKKPPQEVAATAQIVLDINQCGLVRMTATCWGKPDSSYVPMPADRLLTRTLPFVLAELREQLKLGRHVTTDESAAIKAHLICQAKDALLVGQTNLAVLQSAQFSGQSLSGSATTV